MPQFAIPIPSVTSKASIGTGMSGWSSSSELSRTASDTPVPSYVIGSESCTIFASILAAPRSLSGREARSVLAQRAEMTPVERLLVDLGGKFGILDGGWDSSERTDA